MYGGYLSYGGVEIVNAERVGAYAGTPYTPRLMQRHPAPELAEVLGHGEYTDAVSDGAPWIREGVAYAEEFLGFYPLAIQGIDDSTLTSSMTSLIDDGAIAAPPSHGPREIRVRGVLIATSLRGVEVGAAWLRGAMERTPCTPGDACGGEEVVYYQAQPEAAAPALHKRTLFRVATLSGLRTVRDYAPVRGALREVEFILVAGTPWGFADPVQVVNSALLSGTAGTAEVACPSLAYTTDDLVLDPALPALPTPPAPPAITPTPMPTTWTRYPALIPASISDRPGRVAPVITMTTTGSARRNVRVRFYRDTNATLGLDVPVCDYLGEVMVTYVPADSVLTIDARTREIYVEVAGGDPQPAGHLALGSSGRPIRWPTLSCQSAYTVLIDSETALTGTTVLIDVAIGG